MWTINFLIARLLWGARVEGELRLPSHQGAVIVANHCSSIDPSFIQLYMRRVVHWMVAREYCESGFAGWLLSKLQVISVGRGGIDTAAIKQAIRLTRAGGLVGIFPEGRINESHQTLLLPGRPGAALVALRARVPIIPMYIAGSPYDGTSLGPLLMRARVRIKIGPSLDLSSYFGREKAEGVMEEITRRVLQEIAKLAGQPEFQPELAGRRWRLGDEEAEIASENISASSKNGEVGEGSPREFPRDNPAVNG
jgi:1-acyl-sn-glycerol-3-phosphate acyltransferase